MPTQSSTLVRGTPVSGLVFGQAALPPMPPDPAWGSMSLAIPATAADAARDSGNLQRQLRKGMPAEPSDTVPTVVHYTLEAIEGVEVGLTIFGGMHLLGALALPLEIAGPVAGMAAVFVALGNAHAEAINSVIADELKSGFSRGVVLGADERKPDYVKSNFVKFSPVRHDVYPERGVQFQQAYNRGLIAGYAQGKALGHAESKAFFLDLFGRMSVHPSTTYGGDSKWWSERTWMDYYIDVAAVFRRDHLR